jgi:adenylate kinase
MKTVHTFVMVGKPGSGKSTQAELIGKRFGYKTISTGRICRAIAKRDTFVGRKTKFIIDSGGLMPSWFSAYLFERELIEHESDQGIVFEGIVRTEPEAVFFHDVMEFFERSYIVFNIVIPDEVAIERLTLRSERADDNANVIPDRLEKYEEHTAPSIEYLRSKGKVVDIDGTLSIEEIHQSILKEIEARA